ncbi:UDP-glycosyltransferase 84B2-like [Cucurbita moschata]|uniref:Glycosyltransferase n=1 Tax=Cucurbita moschata TaxID=3662 RepID=A0A6J1G7R2_CUCMO|nr:UDP-glycosyltransferase 84B2-like [Cucurbita moschata]
MALHQNIHVLMATPAVHSHLNPMLKLAKCLITKGIHVTIATTEPARHSMLKHTTTADANATNPSIQFEFFSDGLDLDFDRHSNYDYWIDVVRTKGCKNLSDLIVKLSQRTKFSCLILHQFNPFFIPVAKQNNLPCVVLWIHPCALYSIYYHFFNKLDDFTILQNPNEALRLPGLPLLDFDDLPSFILPKAHPSLQKLISDFFTFLGDVKWILGDSFYELEEEVLESMSGVVRPMVFPIGPLVSPFLLGKEEEEKKEERDYGLSVDMWVADDSCLQWLDGQDLGSVVYVSFGSLIVLSQEKIDNIANGLWMSGKPFLWVLKRPSPEESTVRLPDGFLEATSGRRLVVNWCPQEQVLKHKAVGCFLTHCGWSSTLETVVAGVPVIALPEWTDQPTNAKLLTDVFKMGVRMRKGDGGIVSSKEVERCIWEMTDGPNATAMAKRAAELMEAGKRAVEDGGSSHRNLDLFIADIVGKNVTAEVHANAEIA